MTRTLQQMAYAQGHRHLAGSTSRLAGLNAAAKQAPSNVLRDGACDEVVFRVLAEQRSPGGQRQTR